MLYNFFNRSLGTWTSHRSYYYVNKEELINSTTEFIWKLNDFDPELNFVKYSVSWNNEIQNSQGNITCYFEKDGQVIYRNAGYFTSKSTESKVVVCSDDILKTITEYNNMRFVETIEFLTDILRVRRTVAYSMKDNTIFLIGNYIEYKKGE